MRITLALGTSVQLQPSRQAGFVLRSLRLVWVLLTMEAMGVSVVAANEDDCPQVKPRPGNVHSAEACDEPQAISDGTNRSGAEIAQ
jgi:hypothetical protein